MLLSILLILLIITCSTLGLDLILYFKQVYSRIHIGRWNNIKDWLLAVEKINLKWLHKTPTVKLTDNGSYVIKDIIKGHYRNNTIQSWQEAGSLLGAIATQNKKSEITAFIDSKIHAHNGRWKQAPKFVDYGMFAYALSKTTDDHTRYKPAYDEVIALIESCKGSDGTIFYRDFLPNNRFVDTIGFICPFLTFYGQTYNKPEYIDLAILQIKAYVRDGFLKAPFLPVHAFDQTRNNMPLGIYGWGRGLGWFILGIVDTYNELEETHAEKEYLRELILKTASDALTLQQPNGSFNAMLAIPSSRHDSSITTLTGWLFYNAFLLDNKQVYWNAAEGCVNALMKATRRNGAIDFCQGDTKGMGIYATTFDVMPFAQGLAIRLVKNMKSI